MRPPFYWLSYLLLLYNTPHILLATGRCLYHSLRVCCSLRLSKSGAVSPTDLCKVLTNARVTSFSSRSRPLGLRLRSFPTTVARRGALPVDADMPFAVEMGVVQQAPGPVAGTGMEPLGAEAMDPGMAGARHRGLP